MRHNLRPITVPVLARARTRVRARLRMRRGATFLTFDTTRFARNVSANIVNIQLSLTPFQSSPLRLRPPPKMAPDSVTFVTLLQVSPRLDAVALQP